ncbi:MAG TPA: cytochrome c [Polyangiaceae bacterium]
MLDRRPPWHARKTLRDLALFAALAAAALTACKGEPTTTTTPPAPATASPDRVPPGITAVQNEMRLLHEALRDAVTAMADGNLAAIAESLHRVDRARELTEQALEEKRYTLPKNPDKLEAFKEKDEAFHAELAKLAAASSGNDAKATGEQLGVVLSKCSDCHTQFRR